MRWTISQAEKSGSNSSRHKTCPRVSLSQSLTLPQFPHLVRTAFTDLRHGHDTSCERRRGQTLQGNRLQSIATVSKITVSGLWRSQDLNHTAVKTPEPTLRVLFKVTQAVSTAVIPWTPGHEVWAAENKWETPTSLGNMEVPDKNHVHVS